MGQNIGSSDLFHHPPGAARRRNHPPLGILLEAKGSTPVQAHEIQRPDLRVLPTQIVMVPSSFAVIWKSWTPGGSWHEWQ
jgi:hypothetical protein